MRRKQTANLHDSSLVSHNNNGNNGEFLYSANTMLCALHTLVTGPVHSCTCSTPFLQHTSLQPFRRQELIAHIFSNDNHDAINLGISVLQIRQVPELSRMPCSTVLWIQVTHNNQPVWPMLTQIWSNTGGIGPAVHQQWTTDRVNHQLAWSSPPGKGYV